MMTLAEYYEDNSGRRLEAVEIITLDDYQPLDKSNYLLQWRNNYVNEPFCGTCYKPAKWIGKDIKLVYDIHKDAMLICKERKK